MNIAYTKRYTAFRQKYSEIFSSGHYSEKWENITQLTDGFSVHSWVYAEKREGAIYSASENELLDKEGANIYTWQNLDDDGEFFTLFCHSNGRHYLIFRCELYGYSVFEVESGQDFHYVPSEAHPEERDKFKETFIWTGAEYCAKNNMLAVKGCYWACPNSVVLLDFVNPLKEQPVEKWLELHAILDPAYEKYDDIEFKCWGENGEIHLRVLNVQTEQYEMISLPADEFIKKMYHTPNY